MKAEDLEGMSIHDRLAKAAGRMPALGKDKKNQAQQFAYRSIEAIVGAARPVFAELGISVTPRVLNWQSEKIESAKGSSGYRVVVEMEYTLGCNDGELVGSMVGEAIDYGDKATSKAGQMAWKYYLTDVLLVASGDDDPDGGSPKPAPKKPKKNPVQTLKESLVKLHGKDEAKTAWQTLFADGAPKPEEMTKENIEAIKKSIATIVEELKPIEEKAE